MNVSFKIALMYDFDKTLCTENMQDYSLIPAMNLDSASFWKEVAANTRSANMDPTLSYMYMILKKAREKGLSIRREAFQALGKDVEYYPGVEGFFKRINAFGASLGAEIQHYIISSGNKEIIDGCSIAPEFTRIYASEFHYDADGNADWPSIAINYTGKTQFLFRINKNILDVYDDSVNENVAPDKRDIPFNHMIYLGDGMTDVPCMRLVKANGGYSIGVYLQDNKTTVSKLLKEDRINFAASADYRENSELDRLLCNIIEKIAAEQKLADYNSRKI